nr:MAG TPA: hypothetical protein [Caudoviricetes sp.]
MIVFSEFAQMLQDKIQAEMDTRSIGDSKNKYKVLISADTADWKKSERDGNIITHYVQGVLFLESSGNITGFDGSNIQTTTDARLEILVPILPGTDASGKKELAEKFRNILDTVFSQNTTTIVITPSGQRNIDLQMNYSLASTGMRRATAMLTECISYVVTLSLTYSPQMVTSSNLIVRLNQQAFLYTHLGISRTSITEGVQKSSGDGTTGGAMATKALATGNTLTVAMDGLIDKNLLTNNTTSFAFLFDYLFYGVQTPVSVFISGDLRNPITKSMILVSCELNGEQSTFASVSMTFAETF